MSTIGGYTVMIVSGELAAPAATGAEISRSGVDGHAWKDRGVKGERATLSTVTDFTSDANMEAAAANYRALQSAYVTVIDRGGHTWDNVFVEHVTITQRSVAAAAVGGVNGGNYILKCEWQALATEPRT